MTFLSGQKRAAPASDETLWWKDILASVDDTGQRRHPSGKRWPKMPMTSDTPLASDWVADPSCS